MQRFPCKTPSQNYVEQLVNDAVANRFDELEIVIDGVPKIANINVLARIFKVDNSEVDYLAIGLNVSALSILYDAVTQTSWYTGIAVGTVLSWTITNDVLTLLTSLGTYSLVQATVLTSVGSALNLDYGSL